MKPNNRVFVITAGRGESVLSALPCASRIVKVEELLEDGESNASAVVLVDLEAWSNESLPEIAADKSNLKFILIHDEPVGEEQRRELLAAGIREILPWPGSRKKLAETVKRLRVDEPGDLLQLHFERINRFREMGLIANSLEMAELFGIVEKVAAANSTVLLQGESGTGKELIARSIHTLSSRRGHHFVGVNTGAIPDNLLEDELFGHVRGAFTSAVKDRRGKFEHAEKGTIFLDEISTMSPALQVKLLRVLQERTFERLGDNRMIRVDVRVIAATNQDLDDLVKKGEFRSDLYFRLNVIPLKIPSLRFRRGDIPVLANYILQKICRENQFSGKSLTLPALRILQDYSWPGNVRELENLLERLVVLNPDLRFIGHEEIPAEIKVGQTGRADSVDTIVPGEIPGDGVMLTEIVRDVERKLILKSLEKTGWNKQQAAKLLGIKRTTLIEKMRKINK